MKKFFFAGFFFCALLAGAQVTKSKSPGKPAEAPVEQAVADTVTEEEAPELPRTEFAVYTKRSKTKKERLKLCINLVGGDSILNYCMNDSLLRDPEVSKVLFQKQDGDSTFVLVYASAFTKDPNFPECPAGKESKLYFVRWNTVRNKATVKQKYIESCYRTITRIGEEKVEDWDGSAPLKISYHRGSHFLDLVFDPQNYKAGIQSANDLDNR